MSVQSFEAASRSQTSLICLSGPFSQLSREDSLVSGEYPTSKSVSSAHCDHRSIRYPLFLRNLRSRNASWSFILSIYVLQEERDRFSTRYLLRYLLQVIEFFCHADPSFKQCLLSPVLSQAGLKVGNNLR